jgi:hypothetical protein
MRPQVCRDFEIRCARCARVRRLPFNYLTNQGLNMEQTSYFEAFDYEGRWKGTATLAAITKAGLQADLKFVLYGRKNLAVDGWACRARA